MRAPGVLHLHVQYGTDGEPARVSVVLAGAAPDERGNLHLTPDCLRLDELEGAINALQDELDTLRERARRVFNGRAIPA